MDPLKSLKLESTGKLVAGNYRRNFIVNHINFRNYSSSNGRDLFVMSTVFFLNKLDAPTLLDLYFNLSKILTPRQEELFRHAYHNEPNAQFKINAAAYIENNYPGFDNELLTLCLLDAEFKKLIPECYLNDRAQIDFQFASILRTFNVGIQNNLSDSEAWYADIIRAPEYS